MKAKLNSFLLALVFVNVTSTALAATWCVNGVSGNDTNNCTSATTACKTIGRAISLAASGDTVEVAAAIYLENLTVGKSLTITGSSSSTTIIDGGGVNTVVTISSGSIVTLSKLTMRNGFWSGIVNSGVLAIDAVYVTGNRACVGGGIANSGVLTVNQSTISGNNVFQAGICTSLGAGIANSGTATINSSTISGNSATGSYGPRGGGILNWRTGTLTVNNSTLTGNTGSNGGAIFNFESGTVRINSSTIGANGTRVNLYNGGPAMTIQNSIVANSTGAPNCYGTITSKGYNLSSDSSCIFNSSGDRNNVSPVLGTLGSHGGPTRTIPLLTGSPAIDAGNPSGCTDGLGHLLKTDQRGKPRPDPEDTAGCDIGAYERQSD